MDAAPPPPTSGAAPAKNPSASAFQSLIEHSACTCDAGVRPCASGIAHPLSQADGIEALCHAVESEAEPLATVTQLLRLCRDEHRSLWENANEPEGKRAGVVAATMLGDLLPDRGTEDVLLGPLRSALAAALRGARGIQPVMVAHALAELIDERFWHTYNDSFERRSPYQPGVGDPIPLSSPDLPAVMDMRPTAPPWRLANRLDETRHVRLAGEWAVQFRVVFDYSLVNVLSRLITADTQIATCHPNRTLDEFSLERDGGERTFPVRPRDTHMQLQEIERLIGEAVRLGASIVVLPELAVTEDMAIELERWVRRPDGPRVLVAGSYHHEDQHGRRDTPRRRRNTAIAWVRGHDVPLVHDKHSPGDEPILEDIRPDGWPELRVYVTGDGWHLVMAICRDLLNPQAVHALSESGANLVLVPAMSETLMTFGGPTSQLVGANQAVVAIANNPAQWPALIGPAGRPARALFGHPGLDRQTRVVTSQKTDPGIAMLTVKDAQIAWRPIPPRTTPCQGTKAERQGSDSRPARARPKWLNLLATDWCQPLPVCPVVESRVLLRQSAVLILLTDGPDGPAVLLSQRTADLSDYPNKWVFPGGSWEPGDADLAATALREAREEIGLDIRNMDVVGALLPRVLLETEFLVTPFLAWADEPVFTLSPNAAEVDDYRFVPVSQLFGELDSGGPTFGVGGRLGTMTRSVLAELANILAPAPSRRVPTA
jgi:8-oxo-dGTP pyrophosphatase MutT (NUDIX family)